MELLIHMNLIKSKLVVTLFLYPFPLLLPPAMPPWDLPDELEKERDGPLSLGLERRAPQPHQVLDL